MQKKARTLYLDTDTDDWVKKEAKEDSRSVVAQINHWLKLIKSGKMKVEGVR